MRSAEWSGCPDSRPGALAHDHRPRAARWCALVSRSTRSTRTLPWAPVFDRVRPAAALGRLDALALHHAARARNKSRPGLVAVASRQVGGRLDVARQHQLRCAAREHQQCFSRPATLGWSDLHRSAGHRIAIAALAASIAAAVALAAVDVTTTTALAATDAAHDAATATAATAATVTAIAAVSVALSAALAAAKPPNGRPALLPTTSVAPSFSTISLRSARYAPAPCACAHLPFFAVLTFTCP